MVFFEPSSVEHTLEPGSPQSAPSRNGAFRSRLRRVARNALIDLRFGWPLAGVFVFRRDSSNSDYGALEEIFRDRIRHDDVLVDVGCGAGRVINHWLRVAPNHRIYGLELHGPLATLTTWRLKRRRNVEIRTGDAVDEMPIDATLLFLFNPFGEETLLRLANRLEAMRRDCDRPLTLLYLNSKHVKVFENHPAFAVEMFRRGDRGFSIDQDLAIVTLSGTGPSATTPPTDRIDNR